MADTILIAPPNALIFISDSSGGKVPVFVPKRSILATDTMISLSCLPDMDGETQITLGSVLEVGSAAPPIFDGMIKTPTSNIVISTVEDEEILSAAVPSLETRIRVWTNRPDEPDEILIGWGS